LLAPPFIANEADIGRIVDRFVQTMNDVLPQ
jgi:adenosylmethionine-8-amino-7-oxononanoate aminotransferase